MLRQMPLVRNVRLSEPIPDLLNRFEIKALARDYQSDTTSRQRLSESDVYRFKQTIEAVANLEVRTMGVAVRFVEGQPYQSADAMRLDVYGPKVLRISTDHNDDPLLGPRVNLMFRTAHDLHHCQSSKCNFNFDGEVCAAAKFLQYFTDWTIGARLIVGQIVSQVAYLRTFGSFPAQKAHLAPVWATNRIVSAYF